MPIVETLLVSGAVASTVAAWRARDDILHAACHAAQEAVSKTAWDEMPERIVLMRHGQSEANVDPSILATKPDNLVELTARGREQALAAGEQLKSILPTDSRIKVVVSPFERTQQTLCCVAKAIGGRAISAVHIDPRVREQEFGNLQADRHMVQAQGKLADQVGRFYYRRVDGESSADVYDRASDFWNSLLTGYSLRDRFMQHTSPREPVDAVLVVTHGLTMRLLLMRYFGWSVETFDSVYNPGNGDMWVLRKHAEMRTYELCTPECAPPMLPWATRQVRAIHRDGRSEDLTLVNYLALPIPHTSSPAVALAHAIAGHGHKLDAVRESEGDGASARLRFVDAVLAKRQVLSAEEVASIDWWCGKISGEGRGLRYDVEEEVTAEERGRPPIGDSEGSAFPSIASTSHHSPDTGHPSSVRAASGSAVHTCAVS